MRNDNNETLSLLMNIQKEYLTTARFHEGQRATVSNLILAVVGALIAVIGLDANTPQTDNILGSVICMLGIYGVIFTRKAYQKAQVYSALAKAVHKKMIDINIDLSFDADKTEILKRHKNDYCLVNWIPIGLLWPILHSFILILGVWVLF